MHSESFHVAIIGAGFSGALLAVHLLQRCRPGDRVYLIEKRASFGRGLAYSTTSLGHLLNVRAANMSAFHDAPNHFVEWLRRKNVRIDGAAPSGDSFVSRRLYGSYIRSLLCEQLWTGGKGRNLFLIPDEAVSIGEDQTGASVTVAGGRSYRVDVAVLAFGNSPRAGGTGPIFRDPWDPQATQGLQPDAPVMIIGTGLTMVDVFQSLTDNGHRGRVHAFSRRGLLPREHAPTHPLTLSVSDLPRTTSVARLARWMRREVAETIDAGGDWRSVFDGLRPHVPDLWRRLSLEERRRFVRHLQPWWDSHRHRVAPQVSQQVRSAIANGRLEVGAARTIELAAGPLSVHVRLRRRGADAIEDLDVARVIDCTGPEAIYQSSRDPLIRDLVERGLGRPDPLGLGLDVGEQGSLVGRDGVASARLFAVGPVTRGTFWEIVAVPDIRMHCVRLANLLMAGSRERLARTLRADTPVTLPVADAAEARTAADARRPAPTWFAGRPQYRDASN